jgi:hypothetical protein
MKGDTALTSRYLRAGAQLAEFRGRHVEGGSHGVVELSNAFEPRIESDLRYREIGLIEKVSREMDAPRAGDSYRRRSQVLEEQPPQVTGAEANTLGQGLDIARIERTLRDQFKRARNYR